METGNKSPPMVVIFLSVHLLQNWNFHNNITLLVGSTIKLRKFYLITLWKIWQVSADSLDDKWSATMVWLTTVNSWLALSTQSQKDLMVLELN